MDRRKDETRAKLLDAALHVVARKGVAATTIHDITEEADVGLGTFYHHFDSKEVLLGPALARMAERLGAALDEASAHLEDPAEVLSVAMRFMVQQVVDETSLGWFVVRTMTLPEIPEGFLRRNRRDLQRGIDARRFKIPNLDTAQAIVCGAVVWTMQARLTGNAPDTAGVHLVGHVLQALGVPAKEALAIARKPLPKINLPLSETATVAQQRGEARHRTSA